jgi:hypothetical protein
MASEIRIKRSASTIAPSSLKSGELAYSYANNADKLYYGRGDDGSGNAQAIVAIGGKAYVDLLDHTAGTLVANTAIIVNEDKKINELLVDDITINSNEIKAVADVNLVLSSSGTGKVAINSGSDQFTLPLNRGSAGYVLTTAADGTTAWQQSSSQLTIEGDAGSSTVNLLTDTIAFTGVAPLSTSIIGTAVQFNIAAATTSAVGVASFNSTDFSVTEGAVSLNSEAVQDIVGGMVTGNTEQGVTVTYDDTGAKLNFSVNNFDIIVQGDVTGTATVTNLTNTTITSTLATVNGSPGTFGAATSVPVITVNAKGLVTSISTATISTSFSVAAETGTAQTFNNGNTLTLAAGTGISTAVNTDQGNVSVTISGTDASTFAKGIASFSSDTFNVSSGAVSVKSGGISNSQLANSTTTIGTTEVALGASATALAGLTDVSVGNLNVTNNTISSTNTDGDIILNPNGQGVVDVSNSRITGLSTPVSSTDAANKQYVDDLAQGIAAKPAVIVATTENLVATYDNGTAGVGATLTATSNGAFPEIDGYNGGQEGWYIFAGVLVKDQTNATENGRYYISDLGSPTSPWVLTRCGICDQANEIPSSFIFVQHGTSYGNTGWVATVDDVSTFVVGTDDITWIQFSSAGSYLPGNGLSLTGTTFNVLLSATGGLDFDGNSIALKSTVAGNGLTISSGVLAVGGTTNRITVSSDSIDIANTYTGQTSITTLGTVATGAWAASAIEATHGGTGLTSVADRAILFGTGTGTLGTTSASNIDGSFLREDASGNPYWSNVIDGGTF